MKQDKQTLGRLTFAAENHQHYGDYAIAWDTGRRYVVPHNGIRVWEGGSVELLQSGDRDPHLRESLSRVFGIDIFTKSELPPVVTPVARRKLAKAWLQHSLFMVDEASGRVFPLDTTAYRRNGLDYLVRWAHPCSVPYGSIKGRVYQPNKAKQKEWLALNKEFLLKAQAMQALSGTVRHIDPQHARALLDKAVHTHTEMEQIGSFMLDKAKFNALISSITHDVLIFPFLRLANSKD